MISRTFKEIRQEFPDNFLVLVDCESRELATGEFEILGAEHVETFKEFRKMYDSYRDYRKKGLDAWFVLPQYKESCVMQQRFSVRILGCEVRDQKMDYSTHQSA